MYHEEQVPNYNIPPQKQDAPMVKLKICIGFICRCVSTVW